MCSQGRALLGLEEWTAASGAFRRGLLLDADSPGLQEGLHEAEVAATTHRMDILKAGTAAVGLQPADLAGDAGHAAAPALTVGSRGTAGKVSGVRGVTGKVGRKGKKAGHADE